MNYERFQFIQNKISRLSFNSKDSIIEIKDTINSIDLFTKNESCSELFIDKLMMDKLMLINKLSDLYFNFAEYKESLSIDEFLFSIYSDNVSLLKRMAISYSILDMKDKANIINKFIKKKYCIEYKNDSISTNCTTLNDETILSEKPNKSLKENNKSLLLAYVSKIFGYSLLSFVAFSTLKSFLK